jgi:hypothetical protein
MRKSPLALLGTVAFFTGMAFLQAALPDAPTITAKLTASPSSLTAYCPAMITFTGMIKVDNVIKAPVVIQYKFVRSDGTSTAPITLNCLGAGVYPVQNTWTPGDTFSGWEAIEVISPALVRSERASFTLTCLPKPYIDMSDIYQPLISNGDLYIDGKNFGTSKGNKNVCFDGQPVLPKPGWIVKQWSDNRIILNIRICDIILWDHTYQISITEGGKVISNFLSIQYRYPMRTPSGMPETIAAGKSVTVNVPNLPASPAGFKLHLYGGNYYGANQPDLPILTWHGAAGCTPGTITATVPLFVDPGSYILRLKKGNIDYAYYDELESANIVVAVLKPILAPIKK